MSPCRWVKRGRRFALSCAPDSHLDLITTMLWLLLLWCSARSGYDDYRGGLWEEHGRHHCATLVT